MCASLLCAAKSSVFLNKQIFKKTHDVEMTAAARPSDAHPERSTVVELGAEVGEAGRSGDHAREVADAGQRGAERPGLVAVVRRGNAAAVAAAEFRVDDAALRPRAAGVVVVRDAVRGGGPAPLGLLLVLHREAEAAAPRQQAEPVDPDEAAVDQPDCGQPRVARDDLPALPAR